MKLIIKLFGILIILSGLVLLISPEIVFDWVEENIKNTSFYIFAIVVRLVIGVLSLVTATESKYPVIIKIFGFLAIIAAIIFICIGKESFQDFFSSLIINFKPYAPLSGLIAMVLGGFLFYAFSGNSELEHKSN